VNIHNVVGIETEKGFKSIELAHGDLMHLKQDIDILVFSALQYSYEPLRGTLIEAIENKLNVNIYKLSKDPFIDLRASFHSWIHPIVDTTCNYKFLLCAEAPQISSPKPVDFANKMIEGLFMMLSVLEAKGITVKSIALPLLGSGSQGIDTALTIREIIDQSYSFFQRTNSLEKILIVERNENYVNKLSSYMDDHLGRKNMIIPHTDILKAIKYELNLVIDKLINKHKKDNKYRVFLETLFELKQNLTNEKPNAVLIGISGRKIIEIITTRLHVISKTGSENLALFNKINNLYSLKIAQWIQSYMHILRIIGNETAHYQDNQNRKPLNLYPSDLTISLFCLKRVLDFWQEWE